MLCLGSYLQLRASCMRACMQANAHEIRHKMSGQRKFPFHPSDAHNVECNRSTVIKFIIALGQVRIDT